MTKQSEIITHTKEKAQEAERPIFSQFLPVSFKKAPPNLLTRQQRYAKSGGKWCKVGKSGCFSVNMS
jgi:hypothetical protein